MAFAARLSALNGLYAEHIRTRPGIAVATIAAAVGLVPLLRYAVSSYQGYIALGKGGIPHNVFGWLLQEAMRPLARGDRANPAPYRDPKVIARFPPLAEQSFLPGPLPQRAGAVPDVPNYVVPQRQMTEQGTPAMNARMTAFLESVAGGNADVFEVRPSHLEGIGTPAIHLREAHRSVLMGKTQVGGETVHVHHESSSHMTLSLKDAEEAVVNGWGERHPLSGRGAVLPWTYLMIYAPRDDGEFEVWQSLVRASCAFFSGGKTVQA